MRRCATPVPPNCLFLSNVYKVSGYYTNVCHGEPVEPLLQMCCPELALHPKILAGCHPELNLF